ncbi:hypothetical protein [Microbacterium sp.]|uniref:hypothetical protein n=1 Tax=Microbacterium sp. TaxID=51671 RepID=UPI003A934130
MFRGALDAVLDARPMTPGAMPIPSPTRMMVAGDSIAEHGTPDTWVRIVATALGLSDTNLGWGGQSALEVAARQGGVMARLTFPGNVIPASGTVTVTADTNPVGGNPGSGPDGGTVYGRVAGVAGSLFLNGADVRFQRTTDGAAVTVPGSVAFVPDRGTATRGDVAILAAGRNYTADVAAIVKAYVGMVAYTNPRFLTLGILPWEGTDPTHTEDAANWALRELWPDRFMDLKAWMLSQDAANAVAYKLTATDNTAIAAGFYPPAYRDDGVHPNVRGRRAIAQLVISRLRSEYGMTLQPGYATPAMPSVVPDHAWDFGGLLPGTNTVSVKARAGALPAEQSVESAAPFVAIVPASFKVPVVTVSPAWVRGSTGAVPAAQTTFLVGALTTTAGATSKIIAAAGGVIFRVSSGNKWELLANSQLITSPGSIDSAPHVFAIVQDGANSALWVDGVKVATAAGASFGAPSSVNIDLGSSSGAPARLAGGWVYRSRLTDTQIQTVSADLAAATIA